MKKFLLFALCICSIAWSQSIPHREKVRPHDQPLKYNVEQIKNNFLSVASYGSPAFDNPYYDFSPIVTAPTNVYYRQAGLSPDGGKIVAQKTYVDGSITRVEVVLMNSDGTGEILISPGDSEYDVLEYSNPFWSDDGTAIGFLEWHSTSNSKVVKYDLTTSMRSYIYEPTGDDDVANCDFLGNSKTQIVFWDYGAGGDVADIYIWDGTTRTNITNTPDYKEYEPVSNGDGTVILYWSGETTTEPVNTTHTLTYSGVTWIKDLGFTPIADSYWPYWSTREDNYIGVTVFSTKDIHFYDNTGNFVFDLTGPGYSGGSGQANFLGTGFEGPSGEIIITSNAGRTTAGRDIVKATPLTVTLTSPANYTNGVSINPTFTWQTLNSPETYNLQIATSPSFSSGAIVVSKTGLTSNSYTLTSSEALSNSATYYWRVQAVKTSAQAISHWSSPFQFQTISSAVPTLVTPANSSTLTSSTIYFSWYTLTYGLKYDLQIDDDASFASPTTIASNTTSTYFIYDGSGLTPGATYKWRVISKTSGGDIISYSAIWEFTTVGIPTPISAYPIDDVTVYTTSPIVYWYLNTYYPGLYFRVRYGTSSGSYTNTSSPTTNYYLTLSGLTEGNTYYYVVDASPSNTFSSYTTSSEESFNVYSSVPTTAPVPVLALPIGGATSYVNPPYLTWYVTTYVTGLKFYVEWDDDSNLDDAPLGNSGWIENYYFVLPLSLSANTYYWRVKSKIGDSGPESTWSTVENFVIPSSASNSAPVPTPIYPAGGITVYTLSPTLNWYAYSTLTLKYDLRYSSQLDGGGQLQDPITISDLDATYYMLSGLTSGTTYYWQVRSKISGSPGSESAWSSITSFITWAGSFAVVPIIGSPDHGQPINSTSAVLSWVIPTKSESPLIYEVEYSKKSNFEKAVKIDNIEKPFVKVDGLEPYSTYYWRVKSKNKDGNVSSPSSIGLFKTNETSEITEVTSDNVTHEFNLYQNYPNPFNPATRINYTLPQDAFVTLKIYDMLGREIKTLISENKNAGNHSVDWNGEDNFGNKVASGTYIYRIVAGNYTSAMKMILLK